MGFFFGYDGFPIVYTVLVLAHLMNFCLGRYGWRYWTCRGSTSADQAGSMCACCPRPQRRPLNADGTVATQREDELSKFDKYMVIPRGVAHSEGSFVHFAHAHNMQIGLKGAFDERPYTIL